MDTHYPKQNKSTKKTHRPKNNSHSNLTLHTKSNLTDQPTAVTGTGSITSGMSKESAMGHRTNVSSDLPSNKEMISAISAAKSSDILETIKETPLSGTGQQVVASAEQLLDATERLLSDKNQNNDVQKILKEGSLAASKLRESSHVHQDIASTLGDARVQAEASAQGLMHRIFDVIKLIVSSHEFRIFLRDFAGLSFDWIEHMSVATIQDMKGQIVDMGSGKEDKSQDESSNENWVSAQKEQHRLQTEGKDRFIQTFCNITAIIKDNSTYKNGVQSVIDIFDAVRGQLQFNDENPSITAAISDEVKEHANAAVDHAVRLVENFGGDLEPLQLAVDQVNVALKHQRPVVDRVLAHFRSLLQNPGDKQLAHDTYVDLVALLQGSGVGNIHKGLGVCDNKKNLDSNTEYDEDTDVQNKTDEVVKSGEEIRSALMQLATACQEFVESMRMDEDIQEVSQSTEALTLALFVDEHTGEAKFKPELLADLQRIVPEIIQQLSLFPVAKIDVSTDDMDVILDNISLRTSILPKDISILTETHFAPDIDSAMSGDVGAVTAGVTGQVEIKLRNVQVRAPDLVFYYYSRPFPSFADVGIADVNVVGQGLDIDLVLIPTPTTSFKTADQTSVSRSLLRVGAVDANVHEIDFYVKRARHNWMYYLARPLVKRIIARQLEKAIEEGLTSAVNSINKTAVHAIQAANKIGSDAATVRAMVTEE